MTQEMYFKRHILPNLEDVIKGRIILFFDTKTIPVLYNVGLVRERTETSGEDDVELVSGKWLLKLDRKQYYVKSIAKDGRLIYEYDINNLNKTKPIMRMI